MKPWRAAAVCLCIATGVYATTTRGDGPPASGRPARAQVVEPVSDASEGWRTFEGTLSAAGQRHTLPTETGRDALTIRLSGALLLTTAGELSRGYGALFIGFDDGDTAGGVGRSLWTDDKGDRIYSTIKSEPFATGRRFAGTITGGTGRYTGIIGTYAFTWQYVVSGEDGTVQGRSVGLKGRFRFRAGEQR